MAITNGPHPDHREDLVRGLKVSTRTAGPAPAVDGSKTEPTPMVFVSGLAMSNRYLVPCLRELGRERYVLAPDLPGVGGSTGAGHRMTMAELADWLKDYLDTIGVPRAVVAGHSLGVQVVVELAARHPGSVEAAVLVSPARDPNCRELWRVAWQLLRDGFRERPTLIGIAVTDYLRTGTVRMLGTLREARRSNALLAARRMPQPTLVVRGSRDPLVRELWAQRLTRAMPSASLVTIPGAPHAVVYSAADDFVAEVRHFLGAIA